MYLCLCLCMSVYIYICACVNVHVCVYVGHLVSSYGFQFYLALVPFVLSNKSRTAHLRTSMSRRGVNIALRVPH